MNTQNDNSIKTADTQYVQRSNLSRKEMLSQYCHLLTRATELKLTNIKVKLDFHFDDDETRFEVLVFSLKKVETGHNNNYYAFYHFWSTSQISQKIEAVLAALKSDDFVTVDDVFNGELFS